MLRTTGKSSKKELERRAWRRLFRALGAPHAEHRRRAPRGGVPVDPHVLAAGGGARARARRVLARAHRRVTQAWDAMELGLRWALECLRVDGVSSQTGFLPNRRNYDLALYVFSEIAEAREAHFKRGERGVREASGNAKARTKAGVRGDEPFTGKFETNDRGARSVENASRTGESGREMSEPMLIIIVRACCLLKIHMKHQDGTSSAAVKVCLSTLRLVVS